MSYPRLGAVVQVSLLVVAHVAARQAPEGTEVGARPINWASGHGTLKEIPQYVLDYAPLVHLNSKEYFWPSDMTEHLGHTTVYMNETEIGGHPTLDDMGDLNELGQGGRYVYLNSNDYIDMWKDGNIKGFPAWLTAQHNIPVPYDDGDGIQAEAMSGGDEYKALESPYKNKDVWWNVGPPTTMSSQEASPTRSKRRSQGPPKSSSSGGRSSAPAVLVVVEKEGGVVDAFWFFYYSYNLGNSVFTFRFGNHVGDWEHSCIRFHHGVPMAVFLSEHEGGKSYTYRAMEKYGERPVIYSASGTHAMYATPGIQDYVLPFRILHDSTNKGPLWDPLLNLYSYDFNTSIDASHDPAAYPQDQPSSLTPSTLNPSAPTSWFHYRGHWGDKFLPRSDHRQYQIGTEKAYVSGPTGPLFKSLRRRTVCPSDKCLLKDSVAQRTWAHRLSIDFLFLIAIACIFAGTAVGIRAACHCCVYCCCGRTGGRRRTKFEEDVVVAGDIEDGAEGSQARERDGLLAGDDLSNRIGSQGNYLAIDR